MDVVQFVEKVCEIQLLECQKDFVRKTYLAAKYGKRLYYIPPRGDTRFVYDLLQAIVIVIVGQERRMCNGVGEKM